MAWLKRLLNVFRSSRVSADIDREMSFHIEERVDALMSSGLTEADARRRAQREFGNDVLQKERTREADVASWMEALLSDLRYGLRSLGATPGFTAVAILSLGLGIGANTAIFNLVDAVMLKYLPVRHPEELVQVKIGDNDSFTNAIWEGVRDRQDVFDGVMAFGLSSFNLANGGEARRVDGSWVSGQYFTMLGVRPALGRLFDVKDDFRGCPGGAVLGHDLWQREYGGARDVLGRTISLDGHPIPIVGVADRSFFGMDVGRRVDVFVPLCAERLIHGSSSMLDRKSTWFIRVIGRPRPDADLKAVNARLGTLATGVFAAAVPENYNTKNREDFLKKTLRVVPAGSGLSYVRTQYSLALVTIMGIVALVLLIACANVANLLLARATVRQREIAVRLAIGASRGRIIRQLLTESLLLSFIGAGVGLLFAQWGAKALVSYLSTSSDRVSLAVGTDWRVMGFAVAVATLTGILFGVAPALRASRVEPQTVIKSNSRSVVEGHSRFSVGKALVVAQIAMSLTLVTGAGLLLGTFHKLSSMDPGFDSDGVLLANVDFSEAKYAEKQQLAIYDQLLRRAGSLPGVHAASVSLNTPVSNNYWMGGILVDGFVPKGPDDAQILSNEVSEGYFTALGSRIIAGRDFTARDAIGARPVTIINEEIARKFFGGTNPVGKTVRFGSVEDPGAPYEVIGVVENAKYGDLREDAQPTAYKAVRQDTVPGEFLSISLRTNGPATALIPGVKQMLTDINPSMSVDFIPLRKQIDQSLVRERMLATLSGFFGGLALLLAVVGLYGIMSYSVARRRNEIGIRIALGSARDRVMRMVLGEVGRLVLFGLVLGTMLALATTRVVESFLFGMHAKDPRTLLLSSGILATVALLAGALPAWRAARLDPMTALREE